MSGVAIEDLLELWSAELRKAKAKLGWLIGHPSVVASAAAFLDTLLGPERRKTGWMRAEAAGDAGPWRQQAVLGRSHWDADALRDVVRDYALETLAEGDAVLVIDETGFLKQGKASCGVARQYTGSAGKITNCQVGVFAAYVSTRGHAFIDRQLYLPKAWTGDPERLAAAHVPEDVKFATKPQLAVAMIERAIGAGVPFAWVAADSVYGVGGVEMALRRAGKGYVLGVASTTQFHSWDKPEPVSGTAEAIAAALPASRWVRLSAGAGTKGPRLYDWAYLELADLDARSLLRLSLRVDDVDTRPADPARPERRENGLLHDMVSEGHADGGAGRGRGAALGDRGRLRDRENRTRPCPQRDPKLAWLASPRLPGDARLRPAHGHPPQGGTPHPKKDHRPNSTSSWSDGPSRRSVVLPGV